MTGPWDGHLSEFTFPLTSGLHRVPVRFRPRMSSCLLEAPSFEVWDMLEAGGWGPLGEF